MSAKNLDKQGRWRSVNVSFRVSPEEDELLETFVKLSGMTKQGYITSRLLRSRTIMKSRASSILSSDRKRLLIR